MQIVTHTRISESGTFLLTEESPREIYITSGASVVLLEQPTPSIALERHVFLEAWSSCRMAGILRGDSSYFLRIHQSDTSTKAECGFVLVTQKNQKLTADIAAHISGVDNASHLHILSLISDNAFVNLNGEVSIAPKSVRAEGYLTEENLLLDEHGSARGVPGLMVKSNDVKAGHSARIERLSNARLFYLRSRGLSKEQARDMMVTHAISQVFGILPEELESHFRTLALAYLKEM